MSSWPVVAPPGRARWRLDSTGIGHVELASRRSTGASPVEAGFNGDWPCLAGQSSLHRGEPGGGRIQRGLAMSSRPVVALPGRAGWRQDSTGIWPCLAGQSSLHRGEPGGGWIQRGLAMSSRPVVAPPGRARWRLDSNRGILPLFR
jgi:hypothetical protein